MLQNRDYIKSTYMGETEYWNLKPPLGIWLIGLAYKIFGYNAFAFVEVLKSLKPYTIPDNSAFISQSKPNDLLLMPNNSTSQSFTKQYHLRIIQKNDEWLLAQK